VAPVDVERAYRLRRAREVRQVLVSGHVARTEHFTVLVLPVSHCQLRFAIIAGRRLGKAVTRNRVRRLVREALRELRAQLHAGHDVVVIAKPPAVGLGLAEVKQSLADAFAKAGLLAG